MTNSLYIPKEPVKPQTSHTSQLVHSAQHSTWGKQAVPWISRVNIYRHFSDTNKPDSPVSTYTQLHNTDLDDSFRVAVIHTLSPTTHTSTQHLWEGSLIQGSKAKLKPSLSLQWLLFSSIRSFHPCPLTPVCFTCFLYKLSIYFRFFFPERFLYWLPPFVIYSVIYSLIYWNPL